MLSFGLFSTNQPKLSLPCSDLPMASDLREADVNIELFENWNYLEVEGGR